MKCPYLSSTSIDLECLLMSSRHGSRTLFLPEQQHTDRSIENGLYLSGTSIHLEWELLLLRKLEIDTKAQAPIIALTPATKT
jgi:hypothetical protein